MKNGLAFILTIFMINSMFRDIGSSTLKFSNENKKSINYSVNEIVEDVERYTRGTNDIFILRNNADFKINLYNGVSMVPFNTLGKGKYTDTEILSIINTRDPIYIKEAISTVYDAYQYFFLSQFKSLPSDYIEIRDENMHDWQFHKTGVEALLTNEGDCSGFAALMNYLIEDDYSETGYFSFNQYDGNGHVINYIKENGKYYFVDMTYINLAITETGNLPSVRDEAVQGNLHEANSLESYIEFYRAMINNEALIFYLSRGNDVPEIATYMENDDIRYYKISEEYDQNLVADYSQGKIKVLKVKKINREIRWNDNPTKLYNRELIGDLDIRYDVRISEYVQDGRGGCDIYFITDGDIPVELRRFDVEYYNKENKIIYKDSKEQQDLFIHYPNLIVKKENLRGVRIGLHDLHNIIKNLEYGILKVNAVDLNNNKISKSFKIDLSQFTKGFNNPNVLSSPYDISTLKYNADYEIPVTNGVNWVPLNTLGQPNTSIRELMDLYRDYSVSDPERIKKEIDSLYEAITYIKVSNKKMGNVVNINILENNIRWEHHMPGQVSIYDEETNCASSSNLLRYLLEDDYDEVGYIMYSHSNAGGHVFNYIKDNDKIYIIDATKYSNNFNLSAIENGNINNYYNSDYILGNLHVVDDIQDYVNYMLANFSNPPSLISWYTAENCLPISSDVKKDTVDIRLPNSYWGKINILFDKKNDGMKYTFIPGPKEYPIKWEPYNVKY